MKKAAITFLILLIAFSFVMPVSNVKANALSTELRLCDEEKEALNLLNELSDEYGFDPLDELLLENVHEISYGKVYRLIQMRDGIKVYDRGLNITADTNGKLLSVNSTYQKIDNVCAQSISEARAIDIAEALYGKAVDAEKIVYSINGISPTYAYYITCDAADVIVSAHDGSILFNEAKSRYVTVNTTQTDYLENSVEVPVEKFNDSSYELSDYTRNIFTVDMQNKTTMDQFKPMSNSNGVFQDKMAISAYSNVIKAYDFYTDPNNTGVSLYGLNGKNNDIWGDYNSPLTDEIALYVLVHYGNNYTNASYGSNTNRSSVMVVGDGNPRDRINHPGAALDVIAHEYQHGVTSFLAGLEYINDSGAIDEAAADMFGMLVEDHELSDERFWLIGENGVSDRYDSIRSIISPGNLYRINYQKRTKLCNSNHNHATAGCDYGGVHDNSTILTHMQYNIYKEMPDVFNKRVIGTLWYSVLAKLSKNATFYEFGEKMMECAAEMGLPDEAVQCIKNNLYKSGITADENSHVVTYRDSKGNVLDEISVKDGENAPELIDPYFKSSSPDKVCVADGYVGSLENITENKQITVKFKEVDRKYTVRYFDGDNKLVQKFVVDYGEAITPPTTATKSGKDNYVYDFTGWDKEITTVTEDATVYAEFQAVKNYKVTFMVEGKVIDEQYVREGGSAIAPPDPEKESTYSKIYVFSGWSASFEDVHSDLTVFANFDELPREYEITFYSEGKMISSYKAQYSEFIKYPTLEARDGYEFKGWYHDEQFTNEAKQNDVVYDNLNFYAKWEEVQPSEPTEPPEDQPQEPDDNEQDDKKNCASCGYISFTNMLPPTMLLLFSSAFAVFLPFRNKKRSKK